MKTIKIIVLFLLVALLGIQMIPIELNQSNVVPNEDLLVLYEAPQNIEVIFKTSCYDCHSNNTVYPWYGKIQPFAWVLQDHIENGKEELNFNEFGSYSKRRKKNKLNSIASQIRDGKMPLDSYTFVHRDSKLSEQEEDEVLAWIENLINNVNNK